MKLNADQVREVQALLDKGELNQGQIAELYGVHRTTISCIKLGKKVGKRADYYRIAGTFKTIPDFEKYEINEDGIVRNILSGQELKPYSDEKGYVSVSLVTESGKVKKRRVHRLMAITFLANPEHKPEVNHINTIKTDNTLSNLEWATNHENMKHSYSMGKHTQVGESNSGAKLTEDNVREIRAKLIRGLHHRTIADQYHVSRETVYAIQAGRVWAHV